MEEITPELMRKNMTEAEWTKIYDMNRDKKLYNNLINSLFPSVHGNDQIKKGQFTNSSSTSFFFYTNNCD